MWPMRSQSYPRRQRLACLPGESAGLGDVIIMHCTYNPQDPSDRSGSSISGRAVQTTLNLHQYYTRLDLIYRCYQVMSTAVKERAAANTSSKQSSKPSGSIPPGSIPRPANFVLGGSAG